jgi:hypothetical protein
MSKTTSLAAALQTFDRAPAISAIPKAKRERSEPRHGRKGQGTAAASFAKPPSRVGKKAIIGYFDPSVSKQLKQMGLDKDLSVQDLLSEAINDLFHKYRKPNIA